MDQEDSIIILDQESTDYDSTDHDSSMASGNLSGSTITDDADELLLSDNESLIEILDEDLEIVDIEVEEKIGNQVDTIQRLVEAFSPEKKELEIIFDSAEEKLRKEEETLKKYLEDLEELKAWGL